MNRDKGYIRIVLDRQDCMTIADALRIFARELTEDCRRDRHDKSLPDKVTDQAERFEAIAAKLARFDGLDCCCEAMISTVRDHGEYMPFSLFPTEWRTVAAALDFLADRLRAADDRINASRMAELAKKTGEIADWCERIIAFADKLKQAAKAETALCEDEESFR